MTTRLQSRPLILSVLPYLICLGLATALGCIQSQQTTKRSIDAPPLTFSEFGARFLASAAGRTGAEDSNTVVSPVSAGLALSLASLGSGGSTATALATMLGNTGLDQADIEKRGASLLSRSAERKDVQLEIANAVWTDSSVSPTKAFEASAHSLGALVGSLNLGSDAAAGTINAWADRATHGKITRILDGAMPDTTLMFIANAVYFKGKWLAPFNKDLTKPRPFTLLSGRTIQVPSMERTSQLRYGSDSGYQMVRLPYVGDQVAMYVILPNSGQYENVARRFAAHGWPASLLAPTSRDVHLVLPKLHVEEYTDLLPVISQLGAGVALDCKRADFSKMVIAKTGRPTRQLCIGKALQKVYIDVDEEGTEAAAVTGIGMVSPTAMPLPFDFVVDRPFFIVLRDESTGADLFVGSIRHP